MIGDSMISTHTEKRLELWQGENIHGAKQSSCGSVINMHSANTERVKSASEKVASSVPVPAERAI